MTAPLVIFDLDGTLIDTAPDLIDSLNHTITGAGLAPVTFDDLTHLVGQGGRVMIRRAFDLRKTPIDERETDRLFAYFIDHYKNHLPGKSRPYPGIIECLDRLADAGMRLAICTNKIEQLAFPLMERLGLSKRFAVMTGGDTFSVRKPDGRHILATIERAGGDPALSVMVGDSVNDIMAAQNAGVSSIAVDFGYSDVPVQSLNPDRVISAYEDLTADVVHTLIGLEAKRAALARQAAK